MSESRPQQGRPLHRQAGRHRAWKWSWARWPGWGRNA